MDETKSPNFYHLMLGLPEETVDPDPYELLCILRDEDNEQVIRRAAVDQNSKLLTWQNSQYHADCDRLMDEVLAARDLLLPDGTQEDEETQLDQESDGDEFDSSFVHNLNSAAEAERADGQGEDGLSTDGVRRRRTVMKKKRRKRKLAKSKSRLPRIPWPSLTFCFLGMSGTQWLVTIAVAIGMSLFIYMFFPGSDLRQFFQFFEYQDP